MDSKVCCVFQLALPLVVALALAGASVEVGLASKAAGAGAYAARQMMTAQVTTMGLEVHRRVLASNPSSSLSLNPDGAACLKACPAPGRPYTGHSCEKVYGCTSSG